MNTKQAEKLITLARDSISSYFSDKEIDVPAKTAEEFKEERGVFVTIHKHGELRGCIGFPEPVYPLWKAVVSAARSAAFGDPRFPQLTEEEYKEIDIEISVLTVPQLVKVKSPEEYPGKIKVGEDGLIIRGPAGSGLLLPQVAVEWKWDALEFLENTCRKAGLGNACWKDADNKIYKFQAEIFCEKGGKKSRKVVQL